jgi:pimeloyl-ACP methyl ester carboxylesterase
LVPKLRDPHRIVHIFEELLHLDQRALVAQIRCPTLVIGGEQDRVIDAVVQRDLAARIPNSRLVLYPAYGHGNDQENPDYRVQVTRFIHAVR